MMLKAFKADMDKKKYKAVKKYSAFLQVIIKDNSKY